MTTVVSFYFEGLWQATGAELSGVAHAGADLEAVGVRGDKRYEEHLLRRLVGLDIGRFRLRIIRGDEVNALLAISSKPTELVARSWA